MIWPILFLVLALVCAILTMFQKVRKNKLFFWISIGLLALFSLLSLLRGIVFAREAFAKLDLTKVTLATVFLYLAIYCFLGFLVVDKQKKIVPSALLLGLLGFGVAFLAFAFTYGRTNLDNETVVSTTSAAKVVLLSLL